jgi:hypothetical protein
MINPFIRLMLLIGEFKSGAKDIHSSSGWTTTNATICLLQGLRGWILCEKRKERK